MSFETIIGIEVHCELKTNTKMFSSAPVNFDAEPNTCVNEIDLAHPGTLPCLNKKAVELALKACLATNCEIDPLIKFDRKNYYYPDLPKGFQITQQFHPIGKNGYVEIKDDQGNPKKIRINRIHMEEDTAKQFHQGESSFIDFNRAGIPLIEIVTEADIRSGKEAQEYVSKLRNILLYLGVSDVKMEEGSMRCDTNVSIREKGSDKFGTKTEIKNLNSIANIQKAIDYEVKRQEEVIINGGEVEQATYRFDEASQKTVMMRKKEGSIDYKFFPEPNILPIRLKNDYIEDIKNNLPELPDQRLSRYISEYKLNEADSNILVNNKELSDFFDLTMKHTDQATIAFNYLLSDVSGYLNAKSLKINEVNLTPESFGALVELIATNKISSKQAKEILPDVIEGKDPIKLVSEKGLSQITNLDEIRNLVNEVLDQNSQSISDYKGGKERALGYLVGQVMKASKGKANPQMAHDIVKAEIDKR